VVRRQGAATVAGKASALYSAPNLSICPNNSSS
jgi:hypothetical protein